MPTYQYYTSHCHRFDIRSEQHAHKLIQFDSILPPHSMIVNVRYDTRSVRRFDETNRWQSNNHPALFVVRGLFDHHGANRTNVSALFGSYNFATVYQYHYRHDLRRLGRVVALSFFDSIDDWIAPRSTGWSWCHDALMSLREGYPIWFDCEGKDYETGISWLYDYCRYERHQLPVCWEIIPCDFLVKYPIHWNAWKQETTFHSFAWQSFVRPGWRVLAKNIETDMSHDIGFIDADNTERSLNNILLPDGEYEISVLTSALFWKDCFDRTVRTISVRPNVTVSPLPLVYNLRSSVGEGMTTIRWSANPSEVADCVFGVWYSPDSPVDVSRPPDNTVWYSNTMTEYQTSFQQNAPAYIAVAPIRTGNQTETGMVKELYLDWNNTPPRAPDDVMLLNKPLPAIDTEIVESRVEEPNVTLWF